jgi:putative pyruvate formate lyase activating enzyme
MAAAVSPSVGQNYMKGLTVVQPGYVDMYYSGELQRRGAELRARLESCDICPRECGVDRLQGATGFCASGYLPIVASFCDHHGEEPPLSGTRGSGAVFFGNCTLKCVFCQNHQVSQGEGHLQDCEIPPRVLTERMLYLQDDLGCHNINLVSPSHFVPQIVEALLYAVPMGLHIPLVYNTSAYDSIATLRCLDGIVDIYLPDLKYASDTWARKFSQAPEYVKHSREAVREMYRQVGVLVVGEDGLARRGLLVRLLVLPNGVAGCEESLLWLARNLSPNVAVSLMCQYYPCHRAPLVPLLSRETSVAEYTAVLRILDELGMENGWTQELDAPETYLPDFGRKGHPFEDMGCAAIAPEDPVLEGPQGRYPA